MRQISINVLRVACVAMFTLVSQSIIAASQNLGRDVRTATVTITVKGGLSRVIEVTQAAGERIDP